MLWCHVCSLQVNSIKLTADRNKRPGYPYIPAALMSKLFPDAQQKQAVELKFIVDDKDSLPPGEPRSYKCCSASTDPWRLTLCTALCESCRSLLAFLSRSDTLRLIATASAV
jgi:hypothetical protein